MWFLPGLPEWRIGIFVRMHHAIADGIAGVATISTFLDVAPDTAEAPALAWTPARAPTARELFTDNLRRHAEGLGGALSTLTRPVTAARRIRAAWPAMRAAFTAVPTPITSLNRRVGPDRNIALIRGDLTQIKQIARAHEAKVNDVLLAVTAGGLRGLLHNRGERVGDLVLPVYVPVTLRRPQHHAQARGNLIGQMLVPLPIGTTDSGRRLRQIAAETATQKAMSHPNLGVVLRSRIARRALLKILDRHPVSTTTADIPGPQLPVYLAGARLLEVFPVLPLVGNVTLGVGALSYAQQVNITAVADRDACPDLDVFAASAQDELQALAAAALVSPGCS
jgi:WS/DGAT/MGAT family acyltransferase